MAKRPTPKKRREKSRGRTQHSIYDQKQIKRLVGRQNSPWGKLAEPKNKAEKAVTKIKA